MRSRRLWVWLVGSLVVAPVTWSQTGDRGIHTRFDSGSAEGWELEDAWQISRVESDHVLTGRGQGIAWWTAGERWSDYSLGFRVKLLAGSLEASFRHGPGGRYFLSFREGALVLGKESPWNEITELARRDFPFPLAAWRTVRIHIVGDRTRAFVESEMVLDYSDARSLASGTVAFETHDQGHALIDDVEVVLGPRSEEPAPGIPDLIVESVTVHVDRRMRGREVAIHTLIRNAGSGMAGDVRVIHQSGDDRMIGDHTIRSLRPGDSTPIRIGGSLEDLTPDQVSVRVDPDDRIDEISEENNHGAGTPVLEPDRPEGWCAVDGEMFASSRVGCEVRGGAFFANQEEAAWYRREGTAPRMGWCLRDGEIVPASEVACGTLGGRFLATEEEVAARRGALRRTALEREDVGPPLRLAMTETTLPPDYRQLFSTLPNQIVDVSPGPGSNSDPGATPYGRMISLAGSGREKLAGRPTAWLGPLQDELVERVAVPGANGDLFVLFFQPSRGWQAVNVTEKTGAGVEGALTSWQSYRATGPPKVEHVAGRSPDGDLYVFFWEPGADWKAVNVSQKTGVKIAGSPTSWVTEDDAGSVEHVAARGLDGSLLVFWWRADLGWQVVNVSDKTGQKIAGDPTDWLTEDDSRTTEHLAARAPNGDLCVFWWHPGIYWQVVNVTAKTGGVKIAGNPTSWITWTDDFTVEHLAVRDPAGDLLVFWWTPETTWQVVNVSQKTGGAKVAGDPTSWITLDSSNEATEHVGVRSSSGDLLVFWWMPDTATWQLVNVSAKTDGVKVAGDPTWWIVSSQGKRVEHVAAVDSQGDLRVFFWQPDAGWRTVNASRLAGSRVLYAGAPFAGVWKSTDYGNVWLQMTRPQPADHQVATGCLGGPTVYDLIVSPEDPDLVHAAVWDESRPGRQSKRGIYRSTDGGRFWSLAHQARWPDSTVVAVTQIRAAPDDPRLLYAAVGVGIAYSTNAGLDWTEVELPGTAEFRDGHWHYHGVWHVAVTPARAGGWRTVYACGDGRFYHSAQSGEVGSWYRDYGLESLYGLPPYGPGQFVRIAPGGQAVYRWGGEGDTWVQIGGPAEDLYAGGEELYATDPTNGDIYRYNGVPLYWTRIGGPGREFAVDSYGRLYGIAPDGSQVVAFDPRTETWSGIGGAAEHLYAGGGLLYATSPTTGGVARYDPDQEQWFSVGGPGRMFAIDDRGDLFGISPDGTQVVAFNRNTSSWSFIGGAAEEIAAGRRLYLRQAATNQVMRYEGTPNSWTPLGMQAQAIYARGDDLFATAAGQGDVYRYDPVETTWNRIGGPGQAFVASYRPGYPSYGPRSTLGKGTASLILEVEPGNPDFVYLGYLDFANGPRYFQAKLDNPTPPIKPRKITLHGTNGYLCNTYAPISEDSRTTLGTATATAFLLANEGSIWLGDFRQFQGGHARRQRAIWRQLPGPPDYYGNSTPSGRVYVKAHPTSSGFHIVYADRCYVHMTNGRPAANEWHRLDGDDIADMYDAASGTSDLETHLGMHVDPHAVWTSESFEVSLRPATGVPDAYAKNHELDTYVGGRMWLSNDGGIYRTWDGGLTWELAYAGPNTLLPVNVAGVSLPGHPAALYMGLTDNDDFFTLDGGQSWETPLGRTGDGGFWISDPLVPWRVVENGAPDRRGPYFFVYVDPGQDGYPDVSADNRHDVRLLPHPTGAIYEGIRGSRVLVRSLATEQNVSSDDYVVVRRKTNGKTELVRAQDLQSRPKMNGWKWGKVDAHYLNKPIWSSVGPEHPENCTIAQASGGHTATVFLIGGQYKLWKSHRGSDGEVDGWDPMVPGKPGAGQATRFFVNPYDTTNIYILDAGDVRRWDEVLDQWNPDPSLTQMITANGEFSGYGHLESCALNDMVFNPDNPLERFAAGNAGVFFTLDGVTWHRILDTNALPSQPRSLYFDRHARALYVACFGRGVLRIGPIPQ